jgi:membrane-associated protein
MDLIHSIIDFILHIDQHLVEMIQQYGTWVYAILFAIIFCETGFVITPFLPGDSILFAAGALAAISSGGLNISLLIILMFIAAFTGNLLNYSIGRFIGPKVYEKNYRLIKRAYLDETKTFFSKYGTLAIVYTRFTPILRTFAPFIAGVGQMSYPKFMLYNFIGGFLWVLCFLLAGYFFGNIPFVKEHFEIIVLGIILISLIPAGYTFIKAGKRRKTIQPK